MQNQYQKSQSDWGDSPKLSFNREILGSQIMTASEALFWYDLLSYASLDSATIDDEGYFLCTEEFLEKSAMEWTRDQQKRMTKSLSEKGLLRIKKQGAPATRWLFLDYIELERRLSKARIKKMKGILSNFQETRRNLKRKQLP
jgi:hypothetical protein